MFRLRVLTDVFQRGGQNQYRLPCDAVNVSSDAINVSSVNRSDDFRKPIVIDRVEPLQRITDVNALVAGIGAMTALPWAVASPRPAVMSSRPRRESR
jgi:hypothetical protein